MQALANAVRSEADRDLTFKPVRRRPPVGAAPACRLAPPPVAAPAPALVRTLALSPPPPPYAPGHRATPASRRRRRPSRTPHVRRPAGAPPRARSPPHAHARTPPRAAARRVRAAPRCRAPCARALGARVACRRTRRAVSLSPRRRSRTRRRSSWRAGARRTLSPTWRSAQWRRSRRSSCSRASTRSRTGRASPTVRRPRGRALTPRTGRRLPAPSAPSLHLTNGGPHTGAGPEIGRQPRGRTAGPLREPIHERLYEQHTAAYAQTLKPEETGDPECTLCAAQALEFRKWPRGA